MIFPFPVPPRAHSGAIHRLRCRISLRATATACLCALATNFAAAAPYIEYLYPAGSPAGQTLDITLGGKSLDGAHEVWISGEGVSGKVLEVRQPTKAQISAATLRDEVASQSAVLRLSIDTNATPGVRDLRIMADDGLSNRFRFEVGLLSEVLEEEPNQTLPQAQLLPPLPVTVNGQITNADRDSFRFRATQGEQLLIQVRARAIKPFLADAVPGWLQARIALYDAASGKKITEADDFYFDPDPVLLWQVPHTGEYIVQVWDALWRGREDFVYRMTIGRLPFIRSLFPLGAAQGPVAISASGINLPGESTVWQADLTGEKPGIRLLGGHAGTVRAFNRRPFEVGVLPEVSEGTASNDTPRDSEKVTPPVVVNGRIDPPGDVDCYRFFARKGERLVLDVMARRLDSPLDAKLRLTVDGRTARKNKANETAPVVNPAERKASLPLFSDDVKDERYGLMTHHADPRIAFTAPADGEYVVHIEDTRQHGGPEFAYRLRIAAQQPDYELRVLPDNLSVTAGSNVLLQLRAFRIDGFDGPITFHTEGLPEGFTLSGATVPARQNTALLTLAVPADAKPGVYRPRFFAEADIPTSSGNDAVKRVRHEVSAAEELMQAFFYTHTVAVEQGYLVVGKAAPFQIELALPADAKVLEIPVDADVGIPVRVMRDSRQKTKPLVRVTATRGGRGIVATAASLAAEETEGIVKVRCTDAKRIGQQGVLIIEGTHRGKNKRTTVTAPALPFRIVAGPMAKEEADTEKIPGNTPASK